MALIKCPECGNQVSTAAPACPSCGYPVAAKAGEEPAAQPAPQAAAPSTQLLLQVRPSWWLYFWHLFFFWLVIPLLIACWRRASVKLQVYPGRLLISRGIFSKAYSEFMARDIRSIDIDQSFINRIVGIGTLTISTAATVDADEKLVGIPNPHAVRDLILVQRGGR